jgi:hypothetical protein
MAAPLGSGKKSVNLASAPAVRASRIRRDPPPKVKEVPVRDVEEHDRRNAVIGVVTFALALFVIMVGFSSVSGCTLDQYEIRLDSKDL